MLRCETRDQSYSSLQAQGESDDGTLFISRMRSQLAGGERQVNIYSASTSFLIFSMNYFKTGISVMSFPYNAFGPLLSLKRPRNVGCMVSGHSLKMQIWDHESFCLVLSANLIKSFSRNQ